MSKPVDGHGRWKFAFGDYDGYWRDGVRHGQGVMRYVSGDVHDGAYSEDEMHGRGRFVFADGRIYEGEFSRGNMHGRGRYIYANGGIYEGEFSDGNMHGRGKLAFADGSTYEGEYCQGKQHGTGKFVFADGSAYEGDYIQGKKHGRGVSSYAVDGKTSLPGLDYSWNAGDKMECGFKFDVRHGACAYTFFNGETFNCTWADGRCPEFKARQRAVRAAPDQASAQARAAADQAVA